MTSRRDFIGLLAAAPFVAPVVAKEMAEAAMTPNAVRSVAGFSPIFVGEGAMIGSRIIEGPFISSSERYSSELIAWPNRNREWRWVYVDNDHDYDFGDDTPNRLHGVTINSDGDAI
jgi:hypothetical protein